MNYKVGDLIDYKKEGFSRLGYVSDIGLYCMDITITFFQYPEFPQKYNIELFELMYKKIG